MKDQWSHDQRPARSNDARMRGPLAKSFDLPWTEHSMRVRPGNHPKRTVIDAAIIQMQANRQHIFQNLRRRLDMLHTRLD